ncbi:MAG: SAM-dependent methyltransferase, partial [Alistipes sp.]|nr:SAM-dependent methyltransferase [Alistipes sp.]
MESYHALCTEEVRRAIHENRDRDPLRIALDGRIPEARLVATEIKYLQRARTKLPSYAEAECILPPLAFE